jgi:hypothetical protein
LTSFCQIFTQNWIKKERKAGHFAQLFPLYVRHSAGGKLSVLKKLKKSSCEISGK